MNYKLFFFACALNLFYVPNLLASPIIGGQEDTFHTYKYHVSIRDGYNPRVENSGKHLCGGTIVHDRYVLSAAHCFLTMRGTDIKEALNPRHDGIAVLSGTSVTRGPGIITQVDKIFIPHEYNREISNISDISILKLDANLNVAENRLSLQILPIDLEHHSLDIYEDKYAFTLGNGWNIVVARKDGVLQLVPRYANKRQILEVYMVPRYLCRSFNFAICAINRDALSIRTCAEGDSGSPLVFNETVIAVVSRGPEDCNRRQLIISTRTSSNIDFIQNAMNENSNHSQMHILAN